MSAPTSKASATGGAKGSRGRETGIPKAKTPFSEAFWACRDGAHPPHQGLRVIERDPAQAGRIDVRAKLDQ
jgi:hypothetical protein